MEKMQNLKLTLLLALFFQNFINAQPEVGKFINTSAGLATASVSGGNASFGAYLNVDYVAATTKWFSLRPYAGGIFTSKSPESVSTNAIILGCKGRLTAPIPYFAPFVELGLGTTFGKLKSIEYQFNNSPKPVEEESSFSFHIPYTLGFAIGKKNKIDLKITIYNQLNIKQYSHVIAVGLQFPIGN
jgi:hypothetical protein